MKGKYNNAETDKVRYNNIIDSLSLDGTQKQILNTSWLHYLTLSDNSAKKGWFSHNFAQITVIVVSLLIPIIEKSRLNSDIFDMNINMVCLLSLLVAEVTALNSQFGFDAKWRHYRKVAETMRNEGDDFFALSGNYENYDSHKEAFKTFLSVITAFKRQEIETYIENKIKQEQSINEKDV